MNTEETREKLAKLRAEREAREAARAEAAEARALAEEVALEEQRALAQDAIEKAAELHGPRGKGFMVIEGASRVFVLRRPSRGEWERLQRDLEGEKLTSYQAQIKLAKSCILWPEMAEGKRAFDALIDALPHAPVAVANGLSRLVGINRSELEGKS